MTKVLETNSQYHANLAIGSTTLKNIALKSILHAFSENKEPSEAMIIGGAFHCAVLEPERFSKEYGVVPKDAPKKPTKAQVNAKKPSLETITSINYWNALQAKHAGKIILDFDDYSKVIAMKNAVLNHPVAKMMLTGGEAEYSYYSIDPITKLAKKARPDYKKNGALIELKSTIDASFEAFARQIGNRKWHMQGAHYVDVHNESENTTLDEIFFIACENTEPHAVAVYRLDIRHIEEGRKECQSSLARLKNFFDRGGDPRSPTTLTSFGYPASIIDIQVPFYLLNKITNEDVA